MAAVGESALKQKLKETATIQWYKGECALKDGIKHIDPTDPKSFENKVRACINRMSRLSFDGHIKQVLDCVNDEEDGNDDLRKDLFQRSLVIACFLAESDDAAEKYAKGKLKKVYVTENKLKKLIDDWTGDEEKITIFWSEDLMTRRWRKAQVADTLSGLIEHIDQSEQEASSQAFSVDAMWDLYFQKFNDILKNVVVELIQGKNDPGKVWEDHAPPTVRSTSTQKEFQRAVIDRYFPKNKSGQREQVKCMLTSSTRNVVTAHLVPHSRACDLKTFNLDEGVINSPENGLLLDQDVQRAFDELTITFLWNFLTNEFYCVVVDPELRRHPTKGQWHGGKLNFNGSKRPYRCILVEHAKKVFHTYSNHGIPKDEQGRLCIHIMGHTRSGTTLYLLDPFDLPIHFSFNEEKTKPHKKFHWTDETEDILKEQRTSVGSSTYAAQLASSSSPTNP